MMQKQERKQNGTGWYNNTLLSNGAEPFILFCHGDEIVQPFIKNAPAIP